MTDERQNDHSTDRKIISYQRIFPLAHDALIAHILSIDNALRRRATETEMAQEIEIGDILQLSATVRLRYLGERFIRREDFKEGRWVESGNATLTEAQFNGWHARKSA